MQVLAAIAVMGLGFSLSRHEQLGPVGVRDIVIAAVVLVVTFGFRSGVDLRLFADGFVRRRRSLLFFVPRTRDRLDEADRMAIRIHLLAAEPNAILSLMKWCTDSPTDRTRMTGHDAAELLTPPPLRERLERSRS